jgi:hypothetical protein
MDQVNGYLFIEGYIHGVSGVQIPVSQILTELRSFQAALAGGGRSVA